MPFALELARRINALHYEDLPPEAVHWAKVGILDTVGVTLAGSDSLPWSQVFSPPAVMFSTALQSGRVGVMILHCAAVALNDPCRDFSFHAP